MLTRSITAAILCGLIAASACSSQTGTPTPYLAGREIYGNVCSACHGSTGQGGVGPELSSVLTTFPSCEDHVLWVGRGSQRWLDEVGPTYGATDKPIKGAMPSMRDQLTTEEILSVVVYERSRFGGLEDIDAEQQCGVPPRP